MTLFLVVGLFFLLTYSKDVKGKAAFNGEQLFPQDSLLDVRHIGLYNMNAYLEEVRKLRFIEKITIEDADVDSLRIYTSKENLRKFVLSFFNRKEINDLQKYEGLPLRIIDEVDRLGFATPRKQIRDSTYLVLPHDFVMGIIQQIDGQEANGN